MTNQLPSPTARVDWNRNFVQRFIYLQGQTDVPLIYFRFVALSIIAAVLQNKVWVEIYPGDPLYPNIYTFLIGPSGVGKGRAIAAGVRMIENCGLAEYCGLLGGTLTSASLVDFLSSKQGSVKAGTSRAYVVHPELASSIKWGEHSDSLIKRMTDLFTADLGNYIDATRTGGVKKAGKPCVSWLAGSTRRWLISNLKADAMGGGFMARGLFVEVWKKPDRVFLPEPPKDYARILGELQLQLATEIYGLEGKFILNREAMEYLRDWYMSRSEPKSEEGQASWNRHRELSLKVAMILSAGTDKSKVIRMDHLYEAITIVEEVKATESDLWTFILSGGKVIDLDYVARKIAIAGEIDHSTLLTTVSSARGILTRRLYELITTLEQAGKIEIQRRRKINPAVGRVKDSVYYVWKSSKPSIISIDFSNDYED